MIIAFQNRNFGMRFIYVVLIPKLYVGIDYFFLVRTLSYKAKIRLINLLCKKRTENYKKQTILKNQIFLLFIE